MTIDIWARIGAFVSENYETGLIVGFIFLAVALVAQVILNGEIENDLIELVERVERLEKACGEDCTDTAKEGE